VHKYEYNERQQQKRQERWPSRLSAVRSQVRIESDIEVDLCVTYHIITASAMRPHAEMYSDQLYAGRWTSLTRTDVLITGDLSLVTLCFSSVANHSVIVCSVASFILLEECRPVPTSCLYA